MATPRTDGVTGVDVRRSGHPRVALLTSSVTSVAGGEQSFTLELVAGLRRRGFDTTVVDPETAPEGGTVFHAAATASLRIAEVDRARRVSRAAWGRRGAFDLVVVNSHAGWAAPELPGITVYHGTRAGFARAMRPWMSRPAYLKARHLIGWFEARSGRSRRIVCVSDTARAEVEELYGHRVERVILNGVDLQRFHAGRDPSRRSDFGLPPGRFLALFTGRPGLQKGTDVLDRIAELLPPEVRIVAAVPHDYRAHSGVTKLVGLPREALPSLYRCCDAFVLPSRWEACSVSVAEALASGLPTVVSRVGHVPRVLETAPRLAEICPMALDPARFADTLCRLAGDHELRHGLGREARLAAEHLHDGERMLDSYVSLLDEQLR